MWGSAPFLDQLRSEVWDRYRRMCRQYGADRVARPSVALIGALAEAAAPSRAQADPLALRAAAQHAADTYEYLVERWQDPRWREVVTVAIAVGLPGLRGEPVPAQAPGGGRVGAWKSTREFLASAGIA